MSFTEDRCLVDSVLSLRTIDHVTRCGSQIICMTRHVLHTVRLFVPQTFLHKTSLWQIYDLESNLYDLYRVGNDLPDIWDEYM